MEIGMVVIRIRVIERMKALRAIEVATETKPNPTPGRIKSKLERKKVIEYRFLSPSTNVEIL